MEGKIDPQAFYDELRASEIGFYTGVPDSTLKDFSAFLLDKEKHERHIIAANEGNAVAMACGYHISSGRYGLVYMQNSGQGNALNPLLSLADPSVYSMPLLILIGWRGQPGIPDEPQHAKQGLVTLSLLECMGIPYIVLDDDWKESTKRIIGVMKEESRPVAIVAPRGSFAPYEYHQSAKESRLKREEAISTILDNIDEGDYVVATTGKTSRELFELRETREQGHSQDFLTVGSMGHTSSIALGMSLGTDALVWCIDGDGSFLMHMGACAVVAQNAPMNFRYIINNNAAHESVGGQPTVAGDIDVEGILRAAGFATVYSADTVGGVSKAVTRMKGEPKSALVITTSQGSRPDLGRPDTTPLQNKVALMKSLNYRRPTSPITNRAQRDA